MKKIIRKIGNSVGIIFNKEEQRISDIEVNDIVDLSDMIVIKKKRKGK